MPARDEFHGNGVRTGTREVCPMFDVNFTGIVFHLILNRQSFVPCDAFLESPKKVFEPGKQVFKLCSVYFVKLVS